MLIALLVGIVVCSAAGMTVVEGRPVSADLLTGREFLEVYMRRQPHFLRHNTIPHKDDEHYNDIASSSLDSDDLSEEDDEDEDESEEESTSEQPDLLTTTLSDIITTTDEPDTTVVETTRSERSTTEAEWGSEEHPSQVVSVRVSSSVVRKKPENNEHRAQEEKKISVSYRIESKAGDSVPSATQTLEKFATKSNVSNYASAEALTYQRINVGSDPQNSPVSYETSVSSASSDSTVRFYREPPNVNYRADGSNREQRTFQDSVFGQRQKPFTKQDLFKTESVQIFTETERNFPKQDDIYKTTPSKPFDKTESVFVKTTEGFGSTRDVYDKLNNNYPKSEVYSNQESIFSKSDQIFDKPQQVYNKQEVDYVKTDEEFIKAPDNEDLYGRRKQKNFSPSQDFPERINQREQDLNSRQSFPEQATQLDQEFGKRRDIVKQTFGKIEPGSQQTFVMDQRESYTPREQSETSNAQPEKNYSLPEKIYSEPEKNYGEPEKNYGEPEKIYGNPEKVYGRPEKVYGEPEKIYSNQEKVYAKPEKVYGEPEKVYGEPEKVYGEPEKLYSRPEKVYGEPQKIYGEPEHNYEVDEAVSVRTNGRTHGVQSPSSKDDKHKFGYVVEGQNFRKYRVEERTSDGFIVGEYGVVSHDDGSLRGVRYTADSNINPRLIYDALVKFLSLK